MFKKLLSNLPFNPSLITQVSFYTRRIKKESAVRRTGLVFMALALVVQFFAVISPAQASLTGSTNDLINAGFTSRDQAVATCRNGGSYGDYGTILHYYGITCDNLANASTTFIKSSAANYNSLGRNDQGTHNSRTNKATHQYPVDITGVQRLYMKDLSSWDSGASSTYKVLQITNNSGKTIYIMYDCGNVVTIGKYDNPIPVEKPAVGGLDAVDCTAITGWAFDQSVPTTAISVQIYIDGALNSVALANISRADVSAAYPVAGANHGFSVATPSAIKNNTAHTVEVFAVGINENNSPNGVNPSIGAKTVTLNCKIPVQQPNPNPCPYNPKILENNPLCIPCKTQPNISQDNPDCAPCTTIKVTTDLNKCLTKHKTATNLTQNLIDAQAKPAQPGDVITYTLTTTNISKETIKKFLVKEDLNDVLDYASISDFHGGAIDKDNNIYWPLKDIKPGETISNQLTIKVKSPLPLTNTPPSDKNRFDLVMTNVYGDTVNVKLPCAGAKCAEIVTTTLPNTGPGTSLLIGFGITAMVGYFFARSRLFATELDIVRHEFNNGGL